MKSSGTLGVLIDDSRRLGFYCENTLPKRSVIVSGIVKDESMKSKDKNSIEAAKLWTDALNRSRVALEKTGVGNYGVA